MMSHEYEDGYIEMEVEPKQVDEILRENGIDEGGPSPWGNSFWTRAIQCTYDGVLTKTKGFPKSTSPALVIGTLLHVCLAHYANALRAGKFAEAENALLEPISIVLAWCRSVLRDGPSHWAQKMYAYASDVQWLVTNYTRHWKPRPGQVGVPWSLDELLRYENPNPFMVEEIVESCHPFPHTVRYDRVYLIKDEDGSDMAVGLDHKSVSDPSPQWVESYWHDPQLCGYFHTWNATAEARGVPMMKHAIIDAIEKPSSYHSFPMFSRNLYSLRPDRIELWAKSMILATRPFLQAWEKIVAARQAGQEVAAPWEIASMNGFVNCFKRRYRACERLHDHCLYLSDMSVYSPAAAPASPAPQQAEPQSETPVDLPPVAQSTPAPQFMLPSTKEQIIYEASTRGLALPGIEALCQQTVYANFDELTEESAQALLLHLTTKMGTPTQAIAVSPQPVAQPAVVNPQQDANEVEFWTLLKELRSLPGADQQYLDFVANAGHETLAQHASTFTGQGNRLIGVTDFRELRLTVAKVLLERAKAVQSQAQTAGIENNMPAVQPTSTNQGAQGSLEQSQPNAVPPQADVGSGGAASVAPSYDPKVKYAPIKLYPEQETVIGAAPCGVWALCAGTLCFTTDEYNSEGDRFVWVQGGVKIAHNSNKPCIPADVQVVDERTTDEKTQEAASAMAEIGEAPALDGMRPVVYIGDHEKLNKQVKELVQAELDKRPCFVVSEMGKDPAKLKLRVWAADDDGKLKSQKTSDLGTQLWNALGRMVTQAKEAQA